MNYRSIAAIGECKARGIDTILKQHAGLRQQIGAGALGVRQKSALLRIEHPKLQPAQKWRSCRARFRWRRIVIQHIHNGERRVDISRPE